MPSVENVRTERVIGIAIDPIHVGTGASQLGRVNNTIVRDPVTRVPKIPGSSLAGVYRTYVAMMWDKYPECAGQGIPDRGGEGGHCKEDDCPVCIAFGYASEAGGGFAGLAGFSDAHIVLFPVATRLGPRWLASPFSLGLESRLSREDVAYTIDADKEEADGRSGESRQPAHNLESTLNFGWLNLEIEELRSEGGDDGIAKEVHQALGAMNVVPPLVRSNIVVVSDRLFTQIVNNNLEVRTSVSINPDTGAAQSGALFTYEAIPRGTVIAWDITLRNPKHFQKDLTIDYVRDKVRSAEKLLAQLGIGGMGTRGLGRLCVPNDDPQADDGGS